MEKIEEVISLIDSHEKKEIQNVFFKYWKKWPWFVFFCMLGVVTGYFFYKNLPQKYKVTSRILIKQEDNNLNSVLTFDNPIMAMGKRSAIENQIGILNSFTLYRKALNKLNWDYSWFREELLYDADLYNNEPFELVVPPNGINATGIPLKIVALNENKYRVVAKGETRLNGYLQNVKFEKTVNFGEPFFNEFFNFTLNRGNGKIGEDYILEFNDVNALTGRYLGKTDIALEDNSDLISISIEGEVPQKEADFINELNNVFIQFGMENKNASSEKSVEFIDSQLARIKKSLGTAEENFSNYRKNNQVMNLGQEAQVVYGRLEEIDQEKYLTQMQVDYYKELQQYLDDSKKMEEMVNPSIVGITDTGLNELISRLMDLYSQRERLSYSVQEKNPQFIVLEREIKYRSGRILKKYSFIQVVNGIKYNPCSAVSL